MINKMDKQLPACVLASEPMERTSPQLGLNLSRVQLRLRPGHP